MEKEIGLLEELIRSFCRITCSSRKNAAFFLRNNEFKLDEAVSSYFDNNKNNASFHARDSRVRPRPSSLRSDEYPSKKPHVNGVAESNKPEKEQCFDDGAQSEMLVSNPRRPENELDNYNERARESEALQMLSELCLPPHPTPSSKAFAGTKRLLSGENVLSVSSSPPQTEVDNRAVYFQRSCFGTGLVIIRRLAYPESDSMLESTKRSKYPEDLQAGERRTVAHFKPVNGNDSHQEVNKPQSSIHCGVGRNILLSCSGITSPASVEPTAAATVASSQMNIIVDESSPFTSIQLWLADGTRMVSRFNYYHTIRDIHAFLDSSMPDGPKFYELQLMGFPPKRLTDLNQTIEHAGIANSVVIQKH